MNGFILIATVTGAFLGTYADKPSCDAALKEILVAQTMPWVYRQQDPAMAFKAEQLVDGYLKWQTDYVCVPQKKVDRKNQ